MVAVCEVDGYDCSSGDTEVVAESVEGKKVEEVVGVLLGG